MSTEKTVVPAAISEYFRGLGKKGGKRSLETMSDRARKTRAKKAAKARWGKKRKAA